MLHCLRTILIYTGLAAISAATTSPALAQDTRTIEEREADIFGVPEPESDESDESVSDESAEDPNAPPADEPPEAQGAEWSEDIRLEDQLARRLAERDEQTLDIGGGLFSQLQYSILERGDPGDFPLNQSNLLDIYLDARPNKRLRVYADGRLLYTPTADARALPATTASAGGLGQFGAPRDEVEAQLDALWVKFDIARTLYVTAGRQHLRWGVGRFWFPNDFLFEQRRDPLALFDVRTGVDIVKLHLPVESLGWNFYAVANLDGANTAKRVGGAARAEFLAGLTELGLSAAAQRDKPTQLGADISTGIGWFDLRAAFSLTHNTQTPFFRGSSNLADFDTITLANAADVEFPEQYSRADDWIPRALAGGEVGIPYNVDDTFYIGAEYFFNGAGYDDANLYPWLILNGAFRPLYTGKHYAALYFLAPSPGDWNDSTFTLATLGNLSDLSFLTRLDFSVRVLTHLRVFAFGSIVYGRRGELRFGLRLPAISPDVLAAAQASGQFEAPEALDLSDGFPAINIPPTRATLGTGLSLNF